MVAYIDGRYVAQFGWQPTATPMFGTATVEDAFGLDPDNSARVLRPGHSFARRERALTVTMTVGVRQPGFPGDGLNLVRASVTCRR